ncbi:MAG: TraR/DksA family transcriptional regulator [Acidobacteria bacterium]|nr:MAG: TraR/DksA family transcriptional regulator [Acidobacteriota bacterium]
MLISKRARPTAVAATAVRDPKFVETQRQQLEVERSRLQGQVRSLNAATGRLHEQLYSDLVDQAQSDAPEEVLHALGELDRRKLHDVEIALRRIELGGYGICDGCGTPIAEARLAALPATAFCVPCQEAGELEVELATRGVSRALPNEAWSLLGAIS